MYQCELCKKVTPPGTKAHRVVVETRPRTYPPQLKRQWIGAKPIKDYMFGRTGEGWEIVREVMACPDCAAQRPTSGFP